MAVVLSKIIGCFRSLRPNAFLLITVVAALCVALPIGVIFAYLFTGASDVWTHLLDTLLGRYVANSAWLSLLVACGVVVIGVPTAWIVSVYRFPGRSILSWLLLLPMAYPAYILAYTYTSVLDFSGPVLTWMREMGMSEWLMAPLLGLRSLPGAAVMLSLVLYPYVYLMSRAAFLDQSVNLMEAGYTLGQSRWAVFRRVVMPMSRPAIAAGTMLAIMETLADFGTVQFFGVQTFTTGIVRTYYGLGDTIGAAQLSSLLLGFVAFLVLAERVSRHRIRYYSDRLRKLDQTAVEVRGLKAVLHQYLNNHL